MSERGSGASASAPESIECDDGDVKRLEVETDLAIYQIRFGEIQIEITGRCNMECRHCRGAFDNSGDMPIDQIQKIVRFGRQFSLDCSQIVISGGEPLLHKQFAKVLETIRANRGNEVTLTTNGSVLSREHVHIIKGLRFSRVMISVSVDSLDPRDHDSFRGHAGAFRKAIQAVDLILAERSPEIEISMRMALRPHQLQDVREMVDFAYRLGCDRVSLSSICPSGRALHDKALWMSREEKRRLIETLFRLRREYPEEFRIDTNDPLKCLVRGHSDRGVGDELVFDGCPAAAVTFNVNANGDMTPCSLLNIPIMNVFGMSIEEMTARYRQSDIVKNMLDMNLGGKCGACSVKYECGGCRARAYARYGDYLSDDPDCWLQ